LGQHRVEPGSTYFQNKTMMMTTHTTDQTMSKSFGISGLCCVLRASIAWTFIGIRR